VVNEGNRESRTENRDPMFDVLISGAGPAGAVAATVLARAGARVLVLDRARFPRDKLCGDTINPGALAVLRRLGLEAALSTGLPIDGMILTGEPDIRIDGRYGRLQGRALRRRELDDVLVHAAAAAGARVEEGVLVQGPVLAASGGEPVVAGLTIKGRDGRSMRVTAPMVIAADGRYSRVARALGLSRAPRRPRRWAVGAYFEGVHALTSCGEMHVRAHHYLGVAPLADGLVNVCLVTTDVMRQSGRELLLTALKNDRQLADRFRGARMVSGPVCLGPLAVECESAGADGLLLAGDASGFVDPMTGDGLHFAFRGGELAAQETLRALEHGGTGAHVRLLAARQREFARKWRFNRVVRLLVTFPATVRASAYGAVIAPHLLQRAIRYAGDVHAA
jgi:geranylgeranyl reductase family protein